jgi:hypothetical protein
MLGSQMEDEQRMHLAVIDVQRVALRKEAQELEVAKWVCRPCGVCACGGCVRGNGCVCVCGLPPVRMCLACVGFASYPACIFHAQVSTR